MLRVTIDGCHKHVAMRSLGDKSTGKPIRSLDNASIRVLLVERIHNIDIPEVSRLERLQALEEDTQRQD